MSNEYRDILLEQLYLEALEKGMTDKEAQAYAEQRCEMYGDPP